MGLTAVATAAGPVLGGLLVDLLSWRAIFVAPLVLPLAAAIVGSVWVPESRLNTDRSVDVVGALLAFLTVSAFSFALIRGSGSWFSFDVVAGFMMAVVAAVAFVRHERNDDDPMLPLTLFRSRVFAGGNVVTLLSFMVSAGAFLFVAVQLQTTLGYRPASAGAALVPIYFIMLIGSPLAGALADRIGPRILVVVGNFVVAAGVWWLSLVDAGSRFVADVLPGLVVLSVGLATLGAPLTSATLSAVGADVQGVASGVHNTVGQLAGLLMIAVLPAVAGLSGLGFDDPDFGSGYRLAMQACTGLCVVAAAVAVFTIPPSPARADAETAANDAPSG
jgi:predicted MFS family arabinose efflux permease